LRIQDFGSTYFLILRKGAEVEYNDLDFALWFMKRIEKF